MSFRRPKHSYTQYITTWIERHRTELLSLDFASCALEAESFVHDLLLHGYGDCGGRNHEMNVTLLRLLGEAWGEELGGVSHLTCLARSIGPNALLRIEKGSLTTEVEYWLETEFGGSLSLTLDRGGGWAKVCVYLPEEVWCGLRFRALLPGECERAQGVVEELLHP